MPYVPGLWEHFDTMEWENTNQKFRGFKSTLPKGPVFQPKNTKGFKNI